MMHLPTYLAAIDGGALAGFACLVALVAAYIIATGGGGPGFPGDPPQH